MNSKKLKNNSVNMLKNAINKNALKEALNNPKSRKEILNILNKVRF